MTEKPSNQKIAKHIAQTVDQTPTAGRDGVAIAPPAYGVDVLDSAASAPTFQRKFAPSAGGEAQMAPPLNRTGLPDALKSGVEALSGFSLDDVRVHTNSPKPAQLNALAYAQGMDIHLAPGQERHLPHEAWHVVQQKQGRVKATMQMMGGVAVNDDSGLEDEASKMGARALQTQPVAATKSCSCHICQRGGHHVSRPLLSPTNFIQRHQMQHQIISPTHAPAPIQRIATPNGDPNAGITAILTAIEAAAAAPAHQTINQADDVLGGPPPHALPDPGAQATFGLAHYANGNFALGSQAFATAAGAIRLGARAPREHAEMSFIVNQGVPLSVWTTQDCCLFCFGYLDTQGIPHLPLRAQPFPQAWTHPILGWQIVRRVPRSSRQRYWVISAPDGTTATYLLVNQAPPIVDVSTERASRYKRKKDDDSDEKDSSKKTASSKRGAGGRPANKRIRVTSS